MATGKLLMEDRLVYTAVLKSRHRTDALLRQLPARHVLFYARPEFGMPVLAELCGDSPLRWKALEQLLEDRLPEEQRFGQVADRITAVDA